MSEFEMLDDGLDQATVEEAVEAADDEVSLRERLAALSRKLRTQEAENAALRERVGQQKAALTKLGASGDYWRGAVSGEERADTVRPLPPSQRSQASGLTHQDVLEATVAAGMNAEQ